MEVNDTTPDYALPCGRDVEMVWHQLETGRIDAHERGCAQCAAVRESLEVLRSATSALTGDTAEPPQDLLSRIMSAVRLEARRHDLLPLPSTAPHIARISTQAIAAVLRFAADSVTGIRARRCRISPAPAQSGELPAIDVELDIAISQRGTTADAFGLARERVMAAAAARIGVRLRRLDLIVVDVFDG